MGDTARRFRVALSYPGEHRDFVSRMADRLAATVGRERVLLDRFFEAEFARPDLDVYLQRLYHDEADLIVVVLCREYDHKDWCRLEWRAIRSLISRRAADVMPIRFDDTRIDGLFLGDGYLDVRGREPEAIADLVLERLAGVSAAGRAEPAQATAAVVNPTRLPRGTALFLGRDDDLALVDRAWADDGTHVLTVVAWGGVGKTSLVAEWMARRARAGWSGFEAVFDWSFYSQGTREQGGASADAFVNAALQFFGDAGRTPATASAWDKGAALARLVGSRRALLVLDGLEPLQHPPGPLAGLVKDPAIVALLEGLALQGRGLCVVTTRERVADLDGFRGTTALEHELKRLSTAAGVELLKALGVRGEADEYARLVEDVRGHALTIRMIGAFLVEAYHGDIRQRDLVSLADVDAEVQGGHAFRVMEAYERWLASEGERGRRQLAVLRLLGLFDRPADAACLAALRAPPAIPGLTDDLMGGAGRDWDLAVSRLKTCGLVDVAEDGAQLDAHPLVREYFATRLREASPEAWRAGHGRLYEHLTTTTKDKERPTLEDLQPLYQAVAHGCLAGRAAEARRDIYRDRILRGSEFYTTRKLGAIGADLGVIACFFVRQWDRVLPGLPDNARSWLLNQAAFRLRALGRLVEAAEPMREGVRSAESARDWVNASIYAGNLSELELSSGDIAAAVRDAERAVEFAERSKDGFWMTSKRTTLADARHQAGLRDEALAGFLEAERFQAIRQPERPLLRTLGNFRYCDLLLVVAERNAWSRILAGSIDATSMAIERCAEVERRGWKMFEWRLTDDSLLTIALDNLNLGRATLYRAMLTDLVSVDSELLGTVHQLVNNAVDGLRRAGQQDDLPRGLLTRALLHHVEGHPDLARADLDEARRIATRGPMPLHLADVALHQARLFRDRAALDEARRLVDKHGYHRRDAELADAEAASAGW